jgi:rhomboid protease GluP
LFRKFNVLTYATAEYGQEIQAGATPGIFDKSLQEWSNRLHMSFNELLLWFGIGSPAAIVVISALPGRTRHFPLVVVCLAIIGLGGMGMLWRRELAGYVAGGSYLILVVVPATVAVCVHRHFLAQHYQKASRLARLLNLCFPYLGWGRRAALLRGFDLVSKNQIPAADEIFGQLVDNGSRDGRSAAWNRMRICNRWSELRDWFCQPEVAAALGRDPALVVMLLRTLGECGVCGELVRTYERYQRTLHQVGYFRDFSRLLVLSFSGRPVAVKRLCETSLRKLPPVVRDFWIGTAELAAGDAVAAQGRLEAIKASDGFSRLDVEWRLRSESPASAELTREELDMIARVERELVSEERVGIRSGTLIRRCAASYVLVVANVLTFLGANLLGQTPGGNSWYEFGELNTWAVYAGEWWRLVTSTFLHVDVGHLLLNMFALFLLGRFIESNLRTMRFVGLYFMSGIGSMAFVHLTNINRDAPYFAVGASGAIMGLTGAAGAIFLLEWLGDRARSVLSALRWVVVVMLVQLGFDLATPRISFMGHVSGFVIGFLVAIVLAATKQRASVGNRPIAA